MESYTLFIKRKNEEFKRENSVSMKDVGRKGRHYFIREAWTFMPQGNLDKKVFILERLKAVKTDGKTAYRKTNREGIEYRLGYYIVGQIGNRKNKWTWGQFCPMIPKNDFNKLLKQAKKEGVILDNK